MEGEIVNRVAKSGLVTFDLEDLLVDFDPLVLDIKEILQDEFILREKVFRDFVKNHDWSQYQDKDVAVDCSIDAILPSWAFMLIGSELNGVARTLVQGSKSDLKAQYINQQIKNIDLSEFQDKRVIVKGCSKEEMPHGAYLQITEKLKSTVLSLMYGEACSAVPVYKRKKS